MTRGRPRCASEPSAVMSCHREPDSERELSNELLKVAGAPATAQTMSVHHLCHTLARWSQGHVSALEPFGERYGHDVDTGEVGRASAGLLAPLRERAGTVLGRHPQSGLLLRDIRKLHLLAGEASINWTMLGQAAQAAKDAHLLECVCLCHPETLRTLRWTVTKLKQSAPQVLTS